MCVGWEQVGHGAVCTCFYCDGSSVWSMTAAGGTDGSRSGDVESEGAALIS